MKKNLFVSMSLAAISLFCGCTGSKSPDAFAQWMDDHEDVLGAGTTCAEGHRFRITYVPACWAAYTSADGIAGYEALLRANDSEQFLFEAGIDPASASQAFIENLVGYADLFLKDDFVLLYGDQRRRCLISQIENNFTVAGRYRFILVFEGTFDPGAQRRIRVQYNDRLFGCSETPLLFDFTQLDLSDIPVLQYKP